MACCLRAVTPFLTAGQKVNGDNFVIRYEPLADRVLWFVNLTAVSNGVYKGFQEVEYNTYGNVYVARILQKRFIAFAKNILALLLKLISTVDTPYHKNYPLT